MIPINIDSTLSPSCFFFLQLVLMSICDVLDIVYIRHKDPKATINFHVTIIIISFCWTTFNMFGLYSLYRKNALILKMYIVGNLVWTLVLGLLVVLQFLDYQGHKHHVWQRLFTFIFFILADIFYFHCWNLYGKTPFLKTVTCNFLCALVVLSLVAICVKQGGISSLWFVLCW